ncbi:MAG: hypothetical protein ABR520_02385 [Mycobacteriales bacterium]|nr:hypothetical protein [Frankia sp.]
MNLDAWCGHCGDNFRLAQIAQESGGRCPRCGFVYNHEYTAVVVTAVNQFVRAAELLDDAASQIADVAPQLHVDRDQFYATLDKHLMR